LSGSVRYEYWTYKPSSRSKLGRIDFANEKEIKESIVFIISKMYFAHTHIQINTYSNFWMG